MNTTDLSTVRGINEFVDKVYELRDSWEKGINLHERLSFDEYFKKEDEIYKEMIEAQKKLPKGLCIGKLCIFGVADGQATYLIVKLGKKISQLVHLPFGDAYQFRGITGDGKIMTELLHPYEVNEALFGCS